MATFRNEKWKEFKPGKHLKFRYAISNYGRLKSFVNKISEGTNLKGSSLEGYKMLRHKVFKKNKVVNKHVFLHKVVATKFIPNRSANKTFVIHLDYNNENNRVNNLQWATYEEMIEHRKHSPRVILANKKLAKFNRERDGHKLSATDVKQIKRKIKSPNRKISLKKIAKEFKISEMQLYRIKSGENWGHVKI